MNTSLAFREEQQPYGDTWQGDLLNQLIPALEKGGIQVEPGSVDATGLTIRFGGRAIRLPFEPVDETPGDQFPALDRYGDAVITNGSAMLSVYRGDGTVAAMGHASERQRHPDCDDIDRIVRADRWGVDPND